ncbi:MAG: hypothetical protein N3E41_08660, partial [Thermofilaceae archaeon]|nr:hypothetical protein [Thermofilaceae archaeon]
AALAAFSTVSAFNSFPVAVGNGEKMKIIERVAFLSILSQLLFVNERLTPPFKPEDFQFFPSCCTIFNVAPPTIEEWLSILSQLLFATGECAMQPFGNPFQFFPSCCAITLRVSSSSIVTR